MQIDLSGKVAIVTGAGRGIGRAIAETLAREKMIVYGTDVQDELLRDLEQTWTKNQWPGGARRCDVTDASEITGVVDEIAAANARLDVLVNNAGIAPGGLLAEMSEAAWDANMNVNLKGTWLMCKAVIPHMKQQKSGRIINAASFAAIVPALGSGAYAASKAGVHYLTRALAGELGPWNITVNCYAPGMIPTEINHFTERPDEEQERLLDTLTLRRWGGADDVANLIAFLASDLAGYITGTMLDISGGKLATQVPRIAYEKAAQQGAYSFE